MIESSAGHPAVPPGTIVVWSDVSCPWASLAVARLHSARKRLGLEEEVHFDHRPFPLELVNGRTPDKGFVEAEVRTIAAHEPDLGWATDDSAASDWPGSTLVALQAVQAAKAEEVGGLAASESLDRALRDAFFRERRPLGDASAVLDVARGCRLVDAAALEAALARGDGSDTVARSARDYEQSGVQGSPHLFLPDGGDVHNPGLTLGKNSAGHPTIEADDPSVYDEILRRALAPAG